MLSRLFCFPGSVPLQYHLHSSRFLSSNLCTNARASSNGRQRWSVRDFHCNNFHEVKNTHLPWFDRGLSALIEDLHERGLADDVSVVAWGEFGRTPRINKNAGRDHWPRVGGGLLAGGGLKTGQVIGATDRLGAAIANRPVHFGEVHATLYHNMGINPNQSTVADLSGRPHYVVDRHQPMPELI